MDQGKPEKGTPKSYSPYPSASSGWKESRLVLTLSQVSWEDKSIRLANKRVDSPTKTCMPGPKARVWLFPWLLGIPSGEGMQKEGWALMKKPAGQRWMESKKWDVWKSEPKLLPGENKSRQGQGIANEPSLFHSVASVSHVPSTFHCSVIGLTMIRLLRGGCEIWRALQPCSPTASSLIYPRNWKGSAFPRPLSIIVSLPYCPECSLLLYFSLLSV